MPTVLNIAASYLVIIEWLHDDDDKTGTWLASHLASRGVQVEIARCRNKIDVIKALEEVADNIISDGKFPVVQFDCHGNEYGFSGPDGFGGRDTLEWEVLAPYLRKLSILTRFNLVVIGAACRGLDSVKTFQGKGVAPFTIAVGFHDTISSGALFDALKELHRGLWRGEGNIRAMVASANRELTSDEAARLIAWDCLSLGASIVSRVVRDHVDDNKEIEAAQRQLIEIKKVMPGAKLLHLLTYRYLHTPAIAQRIVNGWFAYEEIPENRARFSLDVERMYAEAWAGVMDRPFGSLVDWGRN